MIGHHVPVEAIQESGIALERLEVWAHQVDLSIDSLKQTKHYVISEVVAPGACREISGIPKRGDVLIASETDGKPTLTLAGFSLARANDQDLFVGCVTTARDDDQHADFYHMSELALTAEGAGFGAAPRIDQILDNRQSACAEVTVKLRLFGVCEPSGVNAVTASALVVGVCELGWDGADVTTDAAAETFAIDWDGDTFEDARLDADVSALSASRRVSDATNVYVWLYNGAERRAAHRLPRLRRTENSET